MKLGIERQINVPFAIHERPYLKCVLNGIESYARHRGNWRLRLPYFFMMTPFFDMARGFGHEIEGVISGVPTRDKLRSIHETKLPTVLINCPPPTPDWAGNVELDFSVLARLAVEHFEKQRFARLAFFGSTHPERSDHQRYRKAVFQAAEANKTGVSFFD